MKRLLALLYLPYQWLVFFPIFVVSTFMLGSLTILLALVLSPRWVSILCGVTWARINAAMTPIFVTVSGRQNITSKQSYVVVANHQSHYDVFVLYGWLGLDFKWVMKHELRKVPGLGIGCEKVGHIFIDRSNHRAALASIAAAKEKISNGTSVAFFPEGTRSSDGNVGRFKKGAFRMALELGLPILPVSIVGTFAILPRNSARLRPGRAKLIIHPPVSTEGYSAEQIPSLIETVRETVNAPLIKAAGG